MSYTDIVYDIDFDIECHIVYDIYTDIIHYIVHDFKSLIPIFYAGSWQQEL